MEYNYMNKFFKICTMFVIVVTCSGYIHAMTNRDRFMQSYHTRYVLCDSDTDADDQSEIYQEPAINDDQDKPSDTDEQPENVQDDPGINTDDEVQ